MRRSTAIYGRVHCACDIVSGAGLSVALQPGDEVELLVVSEEPQLQRFRAVREAYLPELGMWVSEYPFMDRIAYRSISDAIAAERERERTV